MVNWLEHNSAALLLLLFSKIGIWAPTTMQKKFEISKLKETNSVVTENISLKDGGNQHIRRGS